MFFKPISHLQRSSRKLMHNIPIWPSYINLNPLRIQTANFVHVTAIKRSDPNQPFAVRVMHQHPSADPLGTTTYNVDVLLAEDDEPANVLWQFQIAKGEDVFDRLLAYAQAFGKHGSGDDDYDEYVGAFQGKVNTLVLKRMCLQGGGSNKMKDEYGNTVGITEDEAEIYSSFGEKISDWNLVNEKSGNEGREK